VPAGRESERGAQCARARVCGWFAVRPPNCLAECLDSSVGENVPGKSAPWHVHPILQARAFFRWGGSAYRQQCGSVGVRGWGGVRVASVAVRMQHHSGNDAQARGRREVVLQVKVEEQEWQVGPGWLVSRRHVSGGVVVVAVRPENEVRVSRPVMSQRPAQ